MAVADENRAGGGVTSARAIWDQRAPTLSSRRRWIVLAGAILMAFAGGLAGAALGMDELASPHLSGPRLRVSPPRAVNSASLSRETPPIAPKA